MVSSTAMSGTHEDRQYIPAMKLMWDEVDARFDPKYVLGKLAIASAKHIP